MAIVSTTLATFGGYTFILISLGSPVGGIFGGVLAGSFMWGMDRSILSFSTNLNLSFLVKLLVNIIFSTALTTPLTTLMLMGAVQVRNVDKVESKIEQKQRSIKYNSSDEIIKNLTQEYLQLQHQNSNFKYNNSGIFGRLFPTQEEKLENQHHLEKMSEYHKHEMRIFSKMCAAKEQELEMQIAAALSRKRIVLDAQTKEHIARIYEQFSVTMDGRIKEAFKRYLEGLQYAETLPNEQAKQTAISIVEKKIKQDLDLIQYLIDDLLGKIYSGL
ncbi:hypothetical protein CYANOKiyG1_16290 [Okeania sp. KiyG1]|nr:hypothetical protein CYANOKiyG1_16290 [Okeania sp. KiyG1]